MANPGALGRAIVAGGFAAILSSAAFSAPLDCAKLKVSVQPEPPGYAAQCLAGAHTPPSPPAAPNAPEESDEAYFVNLRSGGMFGQQLLSAGFPTLLYVGHGPQALPIFALDFDNAGTTLWGIDNASRNLGTINLGTGVFTPTVAVTGVTGDTISGMSFDPTSPNVYISVTNGTPVTAASLYTLNTASGVATLVGPLVAYGNPPAIVDIAIGTDGVMYGHDVGGDRLLRINKATAAVTDIGATGLDANFAQGLDVDPETNLLWAAIYLGAGQTRLARFNKLTGTTTVTQSSSNEELEMAIQGTQPQVAARPRLESAFDRMIQAEITETLETAWEALGTNPVPTGPGVVTLFTGPPGPTYNLVDANAVYPEIAPATAGVCSDCYQVSITNAATRPAQHWDVGIFENYPPANTFTGRDFHVGGSFGDVSIGNAFYRFIEAAFHRGVTAGCGPNIYCPSSPVTRGQMAAFVITAKYPGLLPPACAPPNLFSDVPETSPFCRFIEDLSARGVVAGCGGGAYCPDDPVTREQMAVFVLRTLGGQDFVPPACGTPVFPDVPASSPFCRYIEEFYRRGITAGCGGGNYCPGDPVTRGQMSVFLNLGFEFRY